jgi:hypothetical protein
MRRNFKNQQQQQPWMSKSVDNKTTAGYSSLTRLVHLAAYGKKIAPKFFLTALLPFSQAVRYYPTLVNGVTTRALVILRLFDAISLS